MFRSLKKLSIIAGLVVLVLLAVFAWRERRSIERSYYGLQVRSLHESLLAQERAQIPNLPAHQIYNELEWVFGKTYDYPRTRDRLQALRAALADPRNSTARDEQSLEDGSWGKWHTEWFFKLLASYPHSDEPAESIQRIPWRFLDRINSPEKLRAHLDRLLVSNRTVDKRDNRWELNETISVLLRMIPRGYPAGYVYHPQLKSALLDWLMNTARDPATGYWGEHYLNKGVITKTADSSITFHVISYLGGEVPEWPKIIDTTLAIKGAQFGWKTSDHDHMGVVEIFRLGWARATPAQQAAMRSEIQRMLDWCLAHSFKPDGSFRPDQESIEASEYFGASFLVRVGYFDPRLRFWTDQTFTHAPEHRARIIDFVRAHYGSGGSDGRFYASVLSQLGADDVRRELDSNRASPK